jgi:hypothetical protein
LRGGETNRSERLERRRDRSVPSRPEEFAILLLLDLRTKVRPRTEFGITLNRTPCTTRVKILGTTGGIVAVFVVVTASAMIAVQCRTNTRNRGEPMVDVTTTRERRRRSRSSGVETLE